MSKCRARFQGLFPPASTLPPSSTTGHVSSASTDSQQRFWPDLVSFKHMHTQHMAANWFLDDKGMHAKGHLWSFHSSTAHTNAHTGSFGAHTRQTRAFSSPQLPFKTVHLFRSRPAARLETSRPDRTDRSLGRESTDRGRPAEKQREHREKILYFKWCLVLRPKSCQV